MIDDLLNAAVSKFKSGLNLSWEEAGPLLDAMIASDDEEILRDVLTAWNVKGINAEEIYYLAAIMRSRCLRVQSPHQLFIDIVGTGGSRSKSFNVSTAAAFVVAGAGVPVAKHGNRAASSKTGSSDVLAALGVAVDASAAVAEKCLNKLGICFMFAPNHHRLSPVLAAARRKIGEPTIFNCLGPLCNPAGAPIQLIGVWAKELVDKMAFALAKLGTDRAWVVHAESGMDEISLDGTTTVAELNGQNISRFEISPSDFELVRRNIDEWRDTSAEESADIIRGIFNGDDRYVPVRDLVVMNAAAALYLAGRAETLAGGADLARRSIESGSALDKLNSLAGATH